MENMVLSATAIVKVIVGKTTERLNGVITPNKAGFPQGIWKNFRGNFEKNAVREETGG